MSAGDWKEMFAACQSGDLDLVKYHIGNGIDPNYRHPEFMTTGLNASVQAGHLAIIKFLLVNGADPTIEDAWTGENAISIAEKMEKVDLVELLKTY